MQHSLKTLTILLLSILMAINIALAAELTDEPSSTSDRIVSHAYLVTNANSNYPTETHIINLSSEPLTLVGTLYSRNGDQLGQASTPLVTEAIAAGARIKLTATDLETLFGVSTWSGPALLKVAGSADFEVMSLLSNPGGQVSNTNCTTTKSVHGLENRNRNHSSFLRLINEGPKPMTNIAGTLRDENGRMIGQPLQILVRELPGYSATWLRADQIASIFNGWDGKASLSVSADKDASLRLLLLNRQNGKYANFTCNQRGAKAVKFTSCSEPRPEMCAAIYDPVCAARDNGIRCLTTPCDSTEWATYSNGCNACADTLVFRHRAGSCESILEGTK